MIASITHHEILAKLAAPWIEIAPSRRSLPKRSLPAHAHQPSPNVIVAAHPADKTSLDLCSQFRQKHWSPKFNVAHVPSDYCWQIVTPGGERLLIFTWVNWLRNSRPMFEDFCRETNREFGTLTADGQIVLPSGSIPLVDCQLIHEEQLSPRPPVAVKKQSAKSLLAKATALLKCRKSQCEDIDYREPRDAKEAHDEELQEQLKATFHANMTSYEKALSQKFGPPDKAGSGKLKSIPMNGVVWHAVWTIGKKRLYLAVLHEDTELPWVTCLGVTV